MYEWFEISLLIKTTKRNVNVILFLNCKTTLKPLILTLKKKVLHPNILTSFFYFIKQYQTAMILYDSEDHKLILKNLIWQYVTVILYKRQRHDANNFTCSIYYMFVVLILKVAAVRKAITWRNFKLWWNYTPTSDVSLLAFLSMLYLFKLYLLSSVFIFIIQRFCF